MRTRSILLTFVTVFVLGHLSGYLLWWPPDGRPAGRGNTLEAQPATLPAAIDGELTDVERRHVGIFQEVSPSVVHISNIVRRRDFFSYNMLETPQGAGSGFVWDDAGHVVTNYHVVQGGQRFIVYFADGTEADAEPVGGAPNKDLAVLRVKAPRERLRPIRVGSSAGLRVGQEVLAIGNPFGLDQSLTVGIVSALGRELASPAGQPIRDVIQTDAAINPGNSGGPLLDSAGRLIGVNTAIYSPSGASAGIGFAVPVDTVKELVPQLIEHGKPIKPGIGVSLVSDLVARRNGVRGAIVGATTPGGPADRAGITGVQRTRRGEVLGDVIVAVDGQGVDSVNDLALAFEEAGVGATVRLTVVREGRERQVEVTLIALSD
ncbi:MAG TPA: trypsin-like peptidase domain-containing protein [Thermoanaerobaculia bacterium]|jgi:S1-C subfamily serine protease